jgi:hypothetical protein
MMLFVVGQYHQIHLRPSSRDLPWPILGKGLQSDLQRAGEMALECPCYVNRNNPAVSGRVLLERLVILARHHVRSMMHKEEITGWDRFLNIWVHVLGF